MATVKTLGLSDFMLMPPAPHLCQECATKHAPELPHNRDSMFYGVKYQKEHDRAPTWADAMAHCTDEMKAFWVSALTEKGIDVGEAKQ